MLFFSACAEYPVNTIMCEKKDPNDPIPPECVEYNEEKALKASLNQNKILDADEAIEFTKDSK